MSELTNVFTNIADAIRSKTGSSATMTPAQMATAIGGISTGIEKIELSQTAYDNLPLVDKEDPTKLYIINEHDYLYKWDFTKSLVDEVQGVTSVFKGINASRIVRDAQGIHINDDYQCIYLTSLKMGGKTIELDIPWFSYSGLIKNNTSLLYFSSGLDNDEEGEEPFYFKNTYGWCGYDYLGNRVVYIDTTDRNIISGKTIKLRFDNSNKVEVYFDDELIKSASYRRGTKPIYIYLGGVNKQDNSYFTGNSKYMTISGVRIYENEE